MICCIDSYIISSPNEVVPNITGSKLGWAATLLLEVKNQKSSFVRQGPRAMHLWCSARGEKDAGKWGTLTYAHFRFRTPPSRVVGKGYSSLRWSSFGNIRQGGWVGSQIRLMDGDLPELSPVILKMGENQETLVDRWDRKEEPLIAFAAASFQLIYKQLGAKLFS
ncbi:hypothetical protein KY290_001117 [Solanum tuberosum]|uniref:Uncharacterized protein n=1 Tax=Solanum tuberosum TaxID=4113 RepID=A0ABQ7WLD0_SOLTU|nr:hypothetical protein KY290_001117 [Solanum tuberosum]